LAQLAVQLPEQLPLQLPEQSPSQLPLQSARAISGAVSPSPNTANAGISLPPDLRSPRRSNFGPLTAFLVIGRSLWDIPYLLLPLHESVQLAAHAATQVSAHMPVQLPEQVPEQPPPQSPAQAPSQELPQSARAVSGTVSPSPNTAMAGMTLPPVLRNPRRLIVVFLVIAQSSPGEIPDYLLVPLQPFWHEPSQLSWHMPVHDPAQPSAQVPPQSPPHCAVQPPLQVPWHSPSHRLSQSARAGSGAVRPRPRTAKAGMSLLPLLRKPRRSSFRVMANPFPGSVP
jgi:hypothetical protein